MLGELLYLHPPTDPPTPKFRILATYYYKSCIVELLLVHHYIFNRSMIVSSSCLAVDDILKIAFDVRFNIVGSHIHQTLSRL